MKKLPTSDQKPQKYMKNSCLVHKWKEYVELAMIMPRWIWWCLKCFVPCFMILYKMCYMRVMGEGAGGKGLPQERHCH